MKYWVCVNDDGSHRVVGARGFVPKDAIVEVPNKPNGDPVLDLNCIVLTRETDEETGLLELRSKYDEFKAQERQVEMDKGKRNQDKERQFVVEARELLANLDVSSLDSMRKIQDVIYNILRVMGIK